MKRKAAHNTGFASGGASCANFELSASNEL